MFVENRIQKVGMWHDLDNGMGMESLCVSRSRRNIQIKAMLFQHFHNCLFVPEVTRWYVEIVWALAFWTQATASMEVLCFVGGVVFT